MSRRIVDQRSNISVGSRIVDGGGHFRGSLRQDHIALDTDPKKSRSKNYCTHEDLPRMAGICYFKSDGILQYSSSSLQSTSKTLSRTLCACRSPVATARRKLRCRRASAPVRKRVAV